ncbi:adenylate/guanylate cyclase domain-containing protein [Mycobacterium tuberculosis]|uniref:adenylate/guanylate cyclase domain-containing protein n=1 Tax=Mycobacterium tuberculosis TaxID=1773 RepID=UPI0005DCE68E|nr:adenylate/guanylate cyclase domain-containing protein [Mycobacterium tuberculosis]CKR26475.1 cyclase [Mycobacterium tuberculosis]
MTSGEALDSVAESESTPAKKRHKNVLRRRPRFRASIQSKLMVLLLLTSIVSVAAIAAIVYQSGRTSLRAAAYERLTQLRESQKRAVETLFSDLTNSLVIYERGLTVVDAVVRFTAGFDQLADATISPAQQQAIVNYYNNEFITPVERTTGDKLDITALLPTSPAQRYLQAYYTAPFTSDQDAMRLDDAGDGSAWSAANAQFNSYFREIVTRFDYDDAVLLDTRGNIVYTLSKDPDLGTNILTGPYRESNLRDAYLKALGANAVDFTWITDFKPYQPQLGVPTAWLVAPVEAGGKTQGVLALPLPIDKINKIMTADRQWQAAGMGSGTETYLAGPDSLMRSDSRLFLQDPEEYRKQVVAAGTSLAVVNRAIQFGGTTLLQPVATEGLRAAQRGQTGTVTSTDYTGSRELEAYAPLNVPDSDLHWSILATRNDSEAFAAVASFSRALVLVTVGIIVVICVASMLIAHAMVRPIRRLEVGTQKISAGDYEVNIPVKSRDEIGDLTAAFNEMSRNLQTKEELLNEQRKENDRLLLSMMPEPVVERYRLGEQTIAQEHQDVTVLFADILGVDEISSGLSGNELVKIVDELVRQFDSAAEHLGVERIRTLHNGYLAGCGVTTPRLDNIPRTVDFALEMRRIVDRFNCQTGNDLHLRVGINTGDVISGLVGRSSVVYDMWGAAVSLAYQMHSGSPQPGIYVTSQVYEAMRDVWQFTAAGTISVGGLEEPIYRLSERS